MAERLSITVRLDGKEKDKYIKIMEKLSAKIPNLSHSQAMGRIINQVNEEEVCA